MLEGLTRDLGVLSEPVRIRLLALLEGDELGVGELCRVVQLPQSTVSRHLKVLQVAGWIRRRSEGTSGLFRVAPESVEPDGWRLWSVVRDAYLPTLQFEEDRHRKAHVIASRIEASSFFGRRHAEWDTLRREWFGEQFLCAGIAALLPRDFVVADLGCGTGPALIELAPVARQVIGVDREPLMIEAARARTRGLPNVTVTLGDLDALPIEDHTLDAAICMLVLHHVGDLVPVFREAARVLKENGQFVIVDMVAHDREDWAATLGHRHQGFEEQALSLWAQEGGLSLDLFRTLPPTEGARAPPLFLARFRS